MTKIKGIKIKLKVLKYSCKRDASEVQAIEEEVNIAAMAAKTTR